MKLFTILFALGLAASIASVTLAADAGVSQGSIMIQKYTTTPVDLHIPTVGAEVERVTLDNGLVLFLYEDHRIPMLNAQALIRCGSIYDPEEKNGLSGLTGTVMRSGGTKNISADSLNNLLEFIGGSIEVGIGVESGTATLSVLSKDTDLGIRLLADVLRNPAFPQDKLDLAKTEIKNGIRRRNDNLGMVGGRSFRSVIYGSHPYGRVLEWSTVKGITVQDLADCHSRFFAPNNIMIAVSGDFAKEDLLARVKQYFGDWAKSEIQFPPAPLVARKFNPGVFQVHKETNQTNVNIGLLGVKEDNPDKPAIDVMNYILGGGAFASRLTSRVRSDEGLSYSVRSAFDTGSKDYGTFSAGCQTKSITTYKAVGIMMDEIAKMEKSGASDQEVTDARDALVNRFAFNFDSAAKIVRSLMSLEYDGFPSDYYSRYLEALRKVSPADVKTVAQKYLKTKDMSIVVVGNPKAFEKPLTQFGKITDIELTAPDLK
ncbi:insulinase family protein [candidate division GN15 bacterium]|uniref:Insulinase family protein n=1 Tax=candidate division GN15 bacterium TaxID=2072418 RepID=A0A855X3X6_9BACT|nr:MAG: insulinase family protein [candidate division GN15 bacterium]